MKLHSELITLRRLDLRLKWSFIWSAFSVPETTAHQREENSRWCWDGQWLSRSGEEKHFWKEETNHDNNHDHYHNWATLLPLVINYSARGNDKNLEWYRMIQDYLQADRHWLAFLHQLHRVWLLRHSVQRVCAHGDCQVIYNSRESNPSRIFIIGLRCLILLSCKLSTRMFHVERILTTLQEYE